MKTQIIILSTTLFLLTNCTQKKRDIKSVIVKPDTIISFQPKEYEESLFDTILDSETNLRLTIKRYTLMNKGFEVPFKFVDNLTEIVHFRDFAADIKLNVGDRTIYRETIQKEIFDDKITDKDFLSTAFLSLVSLDNYDNSNGLIKIKCMTAQIESDYAYFFDLTLDKNGNKEITLTE